MTPQPSDPTNSATPQGSPDRPAANWTIRIPSPEESERMLREEPRYSALEMMAELQELYGVNVQND